MNDKSHKFRSRSILISSLVALFITFLMTADKIVQLENLTTLMAIWSIPVVTLLFTVIRDSSSPTEHNETVKFKYRGTVIISLIVLIITILMTADKIAPLDNLATLIAIWSIPVALLFFNVIRDFSLYKISNRS